MNKKLRLVFFIFFTIISISVTGLTLIIYSGYRIDFTNLRLVKTGSLYVNTNPSKAEIYLNNEKVNQKTPTIINQLNPGSYNLKLIKDGYKEWEQTVNIEPSITSFVNYDLVIKDIELSPANEFGENIYYSNNGRYVSYVKHNNEKNINSVFIYDVLTKNEFNVYNTNKQIKKITWSNQNSKLLVDMDSKFYLIDINIISIINTISSNNIINLENFVENIDNVYWNEENDNSILVKSKNNLYKLDLKNLKTELIINDFVSTSIVYMNNKIYYIKDSLVNEVNVLNNSSYIYNDFKTNNSTNIKYLDGNFILFNGNNTFYVTKDFKNDNLIQVAGDNIKIDKNYILSWNSHEFNVYDRKEKNMKFTTRYSQKILDLDFYNKNYAILILEGDIKLINIGDNINELNIISNKNSVSKVICLDNKVFVVYKQENTNIISLLNLQ